MRKRFLILELDGEEVNQIYVGGFDLYSAIKKVRELVKKYDCYTYQIVKEER